MTSTLHLTGAGTALITPFTKGGDIDEKAFRALVRRQVDAGIRILVPCGTTGESATLSPAEKERLVRMTVEEAHGRAHVVAGTGSNDTRQAVEQARAVREWGADAALSLAPPYNKPPQDALVDHFTAVAEGSGIPVVVYNVPGRVGCNLDAATTLALAKVPGIAGVKEAAANMSQAMEILRVAPEGFAFLSGEDALTYPFLAMGGHGVISVVGNEAPGQLARMVDGALAGEWDEARRIHFQMLPLMEANFCESNPIPVKFAMSELGLCEDVLRRPLRPLAEGKRPLMQRLIKSLEIAAEAVS
jgi:4-hydroxy-tetrahydrodipicolinate synthase